METKTRYTVVNKRGEELYHADSFFGFIGSTILVQFLGCIVICVIGAIICGIVSMFN